MWQPDEAWVVVPGGRSSTARGLWRAERSDGPCLVKRLDRPDDEAPSALRQPRHPGYWRREADLALVGDLADGPGLRVAETLEVAEDDEGVTLWTRLVEADPPTGPFAARALGRFAAAEPEDRPWLCRDLLATRVAYAEERGGWRTLARTTLADVCDLLWTRRRHLLARYADGPVGRSHGDAVPANLVGRVGEDVVAVDWSAFGVAPVGTDLGYFAVASREGLDVLLGAHLDGLAAEGRTVDAVDAVAITFAARLVATLTVVTRAEWALARAAEGEGALAGKYRHPSVAPHLRALQRQFPVLEALLEL